MKDSTQDAKEKRQKQALARQQHEDDVRAVMGTPAGRRFIWHLLDEATGVFSPSFAADALVTAHNEGRRAVGIALMAKAQALARDTYVWMMEEQLAAKTKAAPQQPEEDSEE